MELFSNNWIPLKICTNEFQVIRSVCFCLQKYIPIKQSGIRSIGKFTIFGFKIFIENKVNEKKIIFLFASLILYFLAE